MTSETDRPETDSEEKKCKYCSATIRKWKVYCSRKCYESWLQENPENNPFWGKCHSDETKEKISKANKGKLSGESNPFFGKHHSEETRKKISEVQKVLQAGENNPFFGKHHSEESIILIKEKNAKYRADNKEAILQRQLNRLSLSKEKLETIYEEYRDTSINLFAWQKKYKVDHRVLKKYIILFGICSEKELDELTFYKKNCKTISYPEDLLYGFLCARFEEKNVVRQYAIKNFKYDFLVKNCLLVEYDGFFWHEQHRNNDLIKNTLAQEKGFRLYRVKENEKRQVDFLAEIQNIQGVLDEIQTGRD